MDDRQALLLAAIANPAEDTPRLALADWLEEHGDEHERARAELIRLQCELARIVEPAPSPPTLQLQARCEDLRNQHLRAWLGPLWDITGSGYRAREFTRGLLHWWYTTAATFVRKDQQSAVCEQFPRLGVGTLMLTGNRKRAQVVAESPALGWVSRFLWRLSELDDPGFRALAASAHTSRIASLEIERPHVGDASLAVLGKSPCWPNLRRLGLNGNAWNGRYTHQGVLEVLNSDRFPRLTELDLTGHQPQGFENPAFYQNTGLQRLRVLWRGEGTSMRELTACPHFTNLEEFGLWDGQVTDANAEVLLTNPAFSQLRKLTLHNLNPGSRRPTATAEQKLRDRFGDGLSLTYSMRCLP